MRRHTRNKATRAGGGKSYSAANCWEAYPEAVGSVFERKYRRAVAEGAAATFEDYWTPSDRWVSVSAYPLEDRGLAIYSRGITQHKRVEQALPASEERFRRYFELGLIRMAITSTEKGCIEVNDEISKILGYERKDMAGDDPSRRPSGRCY